MENQSNGIFLNHSSARKITADLKFYSTNYPIVSEKYKICEQQYSGSKKELLLTEQLLGGCNQDKVSLKEVKLELEKKYTDTYKKYEECEADKPSKVTWFLAGSITATILAIVIGALVIRK